MANPEKKVPGQFGVFEGVIPKASAVQLGEGSRVGALQMRARSFTRPEERLRSG